MINAWRSVARLLAASLAALWAGTAPGQQAPFTIQVPVSLRDIHPDIQGGEIACQVKDAQGVPIAGGTVRFGIDRSTRSFGATVPVAAQMVSGRSPSDARTYECALSLIDSVSGRQRQPGSQVAQGDPKLEPAPGTPFTPLVSGPIPSSLPSVPSSQRPIRSR